MDETLRREVLREMECHVFVSGVQQHEEAADVARMIAELHADGAARRVGPVVMRHLAAFRCEPVDFLQPRLRQHVARDEGTSAKGFGAAADRDETANEVDELGVHLAAGDPVEPARLVVLGVGVVVAVLAARELVAHEQHGRADREEDGGEEIALLPRPHRENLRIGRVALDAIVGREVMGVAVLIILAVRLVVALVVADEIAQREPVVRRDELHGRPRVAAAGFENLSRASDGASEGG